LCVEALCLPARVQQSSHRILSDLLKRTKVEMTKPREG
jgi:hypothetical protein